MNKISGVLNSVAALLWPMIAICIFFVFRGQLRGLLETAKTRKFSVKVGGQELTMEQAIAQVDQRQDVLEKRIRALQIALKGSVTDFEHDKLVGLSGNSSFPVRFSHEMIRELARLRALGYIKANPGYGLTSIYEREHSTDSFDLKRYFGLTTDGLEYLALREELLRSPSSQTES
jgi:hypothetical protein